VYEQIRYEVSDPIATITLNRPQALNAWTDRMGAEVKHAVAQAENDPAAVAIVITGRRGRGFCAGADMKLLSTLSRGGPRRSAAAGARRRSGAIRRSARISAHLHLPDVGAEPVIAAINGPVAGMAVPIVLACAPALRVGPRGVHARILEARTRRRVGIGVAAAGASSAPPMRSTSCSRRARLPADEALRIGLVNRVVPHDELLPTVQKYVAELAAACSPASLQIMKRQVYQQLTRELGPSEKEAIRLMVESFSRPDFKEGVSSFLEKRPPRFGRV
jgi:enoyl-CoA hydratase/carnithine racemase